MARDQYQNRKWNPQTGSWESEVEHIPDPSETMPFIRPPSGTPEAVSRQPEAQPEAQPTNTLSLFIVLAGMLVGVLLMSVIIGALALAYAYL